ncbi:hypothetical protein LTR85_002981 [Meristemomyces frigidus]|nr:hypothetical protein LTR85_002981 [Meristemomyces frigidus]
MDQETWADKVKKVKGVVPEPDVTTADARKVPDVNSTAWDRSDSAVDENTLPSLRSTDANRFLKCSRWTKRACTAVDVPCPDNYAHHFFPEVIDRTHMPVHGTKASSATSQDTSSICVYTGAACALRHDHPVRDDGLEGLSDAHFGGLLRKRPYRLEFAYRCLFCNLKTAQHQEMVDHCRAPMQCRAAMFGLSPNKQQTPTPLVQDGRCKAQLSDQSPADQRSSTQQQLPRGTGLASGETLVKSPSFRQSNPPTQSPATPSTNGQRVRPVGATSSPTSRRNSASTDQHIDTTTAPPLCRKLVLLTNKQRTSSSRTPRSSAEDHAAG